MICQQHDNAYSQDELIVSNLNMMRRQHGQHNKTKEIILRLRQNHRNIKINPVK